MATFTAFASKRYDDEQRPSSVELRALVQSEEAAQELVAMFPKSLRAKSGEVWGFREDGSHGYLHHYVLVRAGLAARHDNDVNETGIKRYRAARRTLERSGHDLQWQDMTVANYQRSVWFFSLEELEAALDRELARAGK